MNISYADSICGCQWRAHPSACAANVYPMMKLAAAARGSAGTGGAGNGCVADAEAGGDEHAGVQVRWGHFIPKRVWVRLGLTKLIVWAE